MSGQDCDGAWGQAPIRSLLALPRALLAPPRIESTDQAEGMMPVSERVRPEPRWPGIHHRSLRNLFHLTCTMRDSLDSGVRRNDVIEIWRHYSQKSLDITMGPMLTSESEKGVVKEMVQQITRPTPQKDQETGACRHHWIIDAPKGPVSRGACRLCREVRGIQELHRSGALGEKIHPRLSLIANSQRQLPPRIWVISKTCKPLGPPTARQFPL